MFGSFAKLQALSKKAPTSKASPAALRRSSFKSFSQIPKEIQEKPLPVPVETASSVQRPGSSKPKGPSSERKEVRNPKIQEYLEGAIRDSSRKNFASYWRRYLEFCKKGCHNIRLEESIGLFLIHLAEKSENRASSLSAKNAIKFYLKLKFPFPRDDIRRHGRWKSDKMVDQYHELSLEKKLAPSKALKFYDD